MRAKCINETFSDCSIDVLDYCKAIKVLQDDNSEFTINFKKNEKFKNGYNASLYRGDKYIAGLKGPVGPKNAYEFFKNTINKFKNKDVLESLNENMRYRTIFGTEVSHTEALQKRIRDLITGIITEERGISEKAFSAYDDVMNEVKIICSENPEIYEEAENYYQKNKRLQGLAEEVYEKYFKKTN